MPKKGFFECVSLKYLLYALILCLVSVVWYLSYTLVFAAAISMYSDRLSNSAPNESSNHTITFTTTTAIPPGGFIRFTPEDGYFLIPSSNFNMGNVALYVATSSDFQLRTTASSTSATEDGVSISTGTSGNIEITLNSTVGIPAGATVRILVGTHSPFATSTDTAIRNPVTPGTYDYTITINDGSTYHESPGYYAIIESVTVGDIDTRESIPPERFNGAPSGLLSGTTVTVEMSLETNEFSKCRYTTASGTAYFSMGNEFTSNYTTVHAKAISVVASTSYTFYVRCIDDEGNINTDDYVISFSIRPEPTGTPGDDGTDEGTGSGTGEGAGDSDPGDGSPSGTDNASGGSSGGGSGGGGGGGSGPSSGGSSGGGGFEGTNRPYQSGDGLVIITGYAFPRSEVVILVDGEIADDTTSASDGSFSITLDAIARGPYTFGVYAIDKNGIRSSTFSTSFTVTGSRGSTLSNVNVMPSIKVTPDPVEPGTPLVVTGYAIPNAVVTIENQNDKSSASLKTFTANSDANGAWSYTINTSGFSKGTYKVRAKAKQEADDLVSTNYSNFTFYGVGETAAVPRSSDLNRDGKVNLTDFSILLFWWNTDGGASNPPADINGDGRVSLTDFSIMIFNWTG